LLLRPGSTCWRTAQAARAAFLLDSATYFSAAKAAMMQARRSIHLLGWAFDPLTQLEPDAQGGGPADDRIGDFLRKLAADRPELDVRILCWKSALPIAASQHFFPHRARRFFAGSRVIFRLDASVPMGACHHQKVLVIDDEIAFCGGGDIATDRWDTVKHRDTDTRRMMPWGMVHGPRHEVMALVDGPAAAELGELVRLRWRRAQQGLHPAPPLPPPAPPTARSALWPAHVAVDFLEVETGIARTEPAWSGFPSVRESQRLHLASIKSAQKLIYLENQYFTSPIVAAALAERLAEPDGPEVVLVGTAHAPSWFDHNTMDRSRAAFFKRLRAADRHGRFHAYFPYTRRGADCIIVHSKVSIVDDRLLRAGSTNLNNRSSGFDTECDLAVEASEAHHAAAIQRFRARLLAHYIGCTPEQFAAAFAEHGSLAGAIEALDTGSPRRLRPATARTGGPVDALIAAFHLGDPSEPADSWRPWRRKRGLAAVQARLTAEIAAAPLSAVSPAGTRAPEPADG
jgi:phosphatidylserine/phosphatidylglycerophosphate/cardiolipin synthase-like enzyme